MHKTVFIRKQITINRKTGLYSSIITLAAVLGFALSMMLGSDDRRLKYWIIMLESVLLLKSSRNKLLIGLGDSLPILLMGFLIGTFTGAATSCGRIGMVALI